MQNIIGDIWNGSLSPVGDCGKSKPEIQALDEQTGVTLERLKALLNEEQCRILEEYVDREDEYIALITEEAFCDGFRLGIKIMTAGLL